jgi:sucrose synthase
LQGNDGNAFEAEFGTFDIGIPKLTLSSSIGNGLHFVSKFLTSRTGFSGLLVETKTSWRSKWKKHILD